MRNIGQVQVSFWATRGFKVLDFILNDNYYFIYYGHHHHHHHHRLTSFFRATARVRRFPRMPFLHTARSCVSSIQSFNFDMSSSTHSLHVFLGLPRPLPFILSTTIFLHADTQSSGCLRTTCPNHLSLPRLTTTETLSMSSRLNSSALAFLSLSLTPHIHLIIILSVLSSLCISSAFIAHVSLPYTIMLWTQVR